MAETYKLDIDTLERNGTSACLAATRAMIARIRELERDKADWMKANAPGGWIDDLRRASQPGGGEADPPSGWKLVPVEPTDEMLDATRGKNCSPGTWNNWQKKRHATIYRQMVTAARASLDGQS